MNSCLMESSNYDIAHDLWNSFRDAVMFKERFFLYHPVLDKLVEIARGRIVTINVSLFTVYMHLGCVLIRTYSEGMIHDKCLV